MKVSVIIVQWTSKDNVLKLKIGRKIQVKIKIRECLAKFDKGKKSVRCKEKKNFWEVAKRNRESSWDEKPAKLDLHYIEVSVKIASLISLLYVDNVIVKQNMIKLSFLKPLISLLDQILDK